LAGKSYDVVVIGAGTGGYSAALRASQLGRSVALIERGERLGGTCLLRGCIPTKAFLRSAEVLDTVNSSKDWGIQATGTIDRDGILAFKKRTVDKLVNGLTGLVKARGIDVVSGRAVLDAPGRVSVDGEEIAAGDIVIATGSRPRVLPFIELGDRVITSDRALELDSVPSSVVVIGAGAIGLEFASFYRSLGAAVTVLEALPRIAPLEDEDSSKEVARVFKKRGIKTMAGVSIASVTESGDAVGVTFRSEDASGSAEPETLAAEMCLVAVGREPVSDGLGYEEAGVRLERGFVKVDETLATSAPGVWAVGDVASTPLQFAHVAFAEGICVAERIAGMDPPPIDYTGVARVTFCSPEVASVGLTEEQATERGEDVEIERYSFQGLGKANILRETGVAKVIARKDDKQVLGVHMVGPHVTDLISEAMLLTNWEASAFDVARLIHPHPTLSESIGEAMLALAGKPLHTQ
jgi:dihydrolipoamide dehydrogenase